MVERAEAAWAADERGRSECGAGAGVEIAQGAERDQAGGVESGVGAVELRGVEGVAEFEAGDGVGVAVEIDEEGEAVTGDGGVERGADGGVEVAPGGLGGRIALGGFLDLAVGVEFRAMEMAGDEGGVTAGASEEFGGEGAGEFEGIEIGAEDTLLAVGDGVGLERAAVRGGEHDGQIPGDRFDVAVGSERRLAGDGRGCGMNRKQGNNGEGDDRPEATHGINGSEPASGARPRWARR